MKKKKLPKLYQETLEVFKHHPRKMFNYKQVAHSIDPGNKSIRGELIRIIQILAKEELIEEVERGKYRYIPSYSIFTGVVEMTQRGAAYVITEELEEDIYVDPDLTETALDGDTVTVELTHQRKGRKPSGKIIEVLERKRTEFVGTLEKMSKYAFVIPDNSKIHVDFFIPKKKFLHAEDGDKVVVRLTDWPSRKQNPYAEVVKVLGEAGKNDTEMHAIVAEFGFETEFLPETIREAEAYPEKVSPKEIAKREDYREVTTLTIDPLTAKDFDDALSIKELDKNHYEVGVHIADVTHYVKEGSAMDEEAYQRGTSVYLVDRTIPMLPERLSNNLCSLRPNVDRPAFSVIFKLGKEGVIKKYRIGKTMIHSDRRFTYEEAQERIEKKKGDFQDEINALNELAYKLREQKVKNGAISFESDEYVFELDDDGAPLSVKKKERVDAHLLVEDFMLLANKTIAEHVFKTYKGNPLPYRVHEPPNREKMATLLLTAKKFGYTIDTQTDASIAQSLNKMNEEIKGKPEERVLHPLAIRSMEKAIYTTEDTAHFGLAFPYYCHFTSPIRRYPDLITHRLLFDYLHKKFHKGKTKQIEQAAKHSSKMEVMAAKAERASVKYKQTEYLSQFTGEQFEGTVSGVTEWGIYVELEDNHCEGMIRINELKDDYYEYYEKEMMVIGRRRKKSFQFGDRLLIEIKKTNIHKRTVDFRLVEKLMS
jgi:ribonuclease R